MCKRVTTGSISVRVCLENRICLIGDFPLFALSVSAHLTYRRRFMQNGQGKSMVRLGDKADHGGSVIECADDLRHKGMGVALEGHRVRCPQCGATVIGM
ncbi:PAAR domain-containing protein [Burkholderia ubonensis]